MLRMCPYDHPIDHLEKVFGNLIPAGSSHGTFGNVSLESGARLEPIFQQVQPTVLLARIASGMQSAGMELESVASFSLR